MTHTNMAGGRLGGGATLVLDKYCTTMLPRLFSPCVLESKAILSVFGLAAGPPQTGKRMQISGCLSEGYLLVEGSRAELVLWPDSQQATLI